MSVLPDAAQSLKEDEARFKREVATSMRGGRVGGESFAYCLVGGKKRSYDDY